MSAVLLPFKNGNVDWECFEAHVTRTLDASLTPAVNMDTGYVNLLDDSGATPLDYAAKLETEETAEFLREQGGKSSEELKAEEKKSAG